MYFSCVSFDKINIQVLKRKKSLVMSEVHSLLTQLITVVVCIPERYQNSYNISCLENMMFGDS